MATGGPINARHALEAVLAVAKSDKHVSPSFAKLSLLLSPLFSQLPAVDQYEIQRTAGDVQKTFAFDPGLADSLEIARPFLNQVGTVWGRDYIAMALLADDQSLYEMARDLARPLSEIRDKWFYFVTESDSHRRIDSWESWWLSAGVRPPTHETKTSTYLLTWDPARFPFGHFQDVAAEVDESGSGTMGWSASERVSVGDRVFLMRHHQLPLGIVGSGSVVKRPRALPHWDEAEAKKGRTYFNVEVNWNALGEYPIISHEALMEGTGEQVLWTQPGSGLAIPPDLAERLESLWFRTLQVPDVPPIFAPRAFIDTDATSSGFGDPSFRPSEQDSLKAKDQAEVFASLLIAEEVPLPYAIGLLGDWGVGKTFFMRLMQENVEFVAGRGVDSDTPGSVSRAAQIEFNAWHYVDSDLWASLASHIFDRLAKELSSSEKQDAILKARRLLRRTIHSSQREQQGAEAAIGEAKAARQEAASQLNEREEERRSRAAKSESYRLRRVWRAVKKVGPTLEHEDWPDIGKLVEDSQTVAKRLGVVQAIESVEDVQKALVGLRRVLHRGSGLARAFASDFTGRQAFWSGLAVAAILAVVVYWPWLLTRLEEELHLREGVISTGLAPLLRIGTAASAAAVWVSKHVRSITSAIDYLETVQAEIRRPREGLEEPSKDEKKLNTEIEELDAQIATEQRKIEEADRQIAAAQAEIQRINAGGLVYDFLEGRVKDSRYLDRLGLISVIRRDFEELKALLKSWRELVKESRDVGDLDIDNRTMRPIERIILYIDDLDRCPPKRVVEVLQAVHLLLAFDLFAVVVAVDSRWLERSLNESYNRRTRENESGAQETVHRFSAHNYLEKIFQIPFTLLPMEKGGYQRLVTQMLETPNNPTVRRQFDKIARARPKADLEDSSPTNSAIEEDPPQRQRQASEADPALPNGSDDKRNPAANPKGRETDGEERQRELKAAEKRLAATLLVEHEKQFISALFPFIDSPRLAKRLVNLYRLIRVSAATHEDSRANDKGDGGRLRVGPAAQGGSIFIDKDNGGYRAALLLLAINVGEPEAAADFFSSLPRSSEVDFSRWLEIERGLSEKGLERTSERTSDNAGRVGLVQRHAALVRIADKTSQVIKNLEEIGGPSLEPKIDIYRHWAGRVGRYSFHWHLKITD